MWSVLGCDLCGTSKLPENCKIWGCPVHLAGHPCWMFVFVRFPPCSSTVLPLQCKSSCDWCVQQWAVYVYFSLYKNRWGGLSPTVIACWLLPWICICGQLAQDLISHFLFQMPEHLSKMALMGWKHLGDDWSNSIGFDFSFLILISLVFLASLSANSWKPVMDLEQNPPQGPWVQERAEK